jgi:hypothetical protein
MRNECHPLLWQSQCPPSAVIVVVVVRVDCDQTSLTTIRDTAAAVPSMSTHSTEVCACGDYAGRFVGTWRLWDSV